jgi:histidinol-phosphate aminotransferase
MTGWADLVRPSLHGLRPYRPGAGLSELRRSLGVDELVKLNWNEDLFGPFEGMRDGVEAELERAWAYPDDIYRRFRALLAERLSVPGDVIVPGHGIQALIGTVVTVFLEPGTAVVAPQTTYGLYGQVSAAAGATVTRVAMDGMAIDLPGMAEAARRTNARIAWVCDPNNPTGSWVAREPWERFLDALPDGCVAVVDEAYGDFVPGDEAPRREQDVLAGRPVVVLRTFSKLHGLAGLRLGYALADAPLAEYLDIVTEPFNVNRAALAAGCAVLARPDLVAARRREVAHARDLLGELLRSAGFRPLPSAANFVLVDVGVDDQALADAVARRGFLVRPGSGFGLPRHVRVTVAPADVVRRAVAAMAEARDELRGA